MSGTCTCDEQWRSLTWTRNGPTPHRVGCQVTSRAGGHRTTEAANASTLAYVIGLMGEERNTPRPIERYVRAQVPILVPFYVSESSRYPFGTTTIGYIEIGLHYEREEKPSAFRAKLLEVGDVAQRMAANGALDENMADAITADLDARIVGLWGDRPRFIEVWSGADDGELPLTQWYAPHRVPACP